MSVDWKSLAAQEPLARRQWADPAKPFPYCVFDGALELGAARQAARDFDTAKFAFGKIPRTEKHAFNKRGGPWDMMSPQQTEIVTQLNSLEFVAYLERITGLRGLQSDPTLMGGGVHEVLPGGYLNVHTDFNIHPKFKTLRALNLIIYLNEDWQDDWGGHLELWDDKVHHPIARFAPVMNRAVLFRTNEVSFHGHPKPLACPPDRRRRSFALYYYLPWNPELAARSNTNYQLVPWQWAELASQIAELVENRTDTLDTVTAALIDRWQTDDIKTAFDWLMSVRTWTLRPDVARVEPKTELFTVPLDEHHDWRAPELTLNNQIRIEDGRYISTGIDPIIITRFERPALSFLLKLKLPPGCDPDPPMLFFDYGEGFSSSYQRVLPTTGEGWHAFRFVSNKPMHALRLDPFSRPAESPDWKMQIATS